MRRPVEPGQYTRYTYTAQGLPLTVTAPADPSGAAPQTSYAYTGFTPSGFPSFYLPSSQTVRTSASNSVVTTSTYNAANKYVPLTSTVDAGAGKLNLTTAFTYDAVGNLTGVDGPRTDVADAIATTYDSERRPTQITDALGKQTRMAYDAEGRPVRTSAQVDTLWLVSCTRYSETGKVIRAWGPSLPIAVSICPSEAAPVPITDTAYDDLDRPFRTTQYLPANEGGNRVTETVYNLDDTVQAVHKAVGTPLAQAYVTYTYTPNGNVDSVKDAKNNLTVHTYDGFDRLARTYYPLPNQPLYANANDYEESRTPRPARGSGTPASSSSANSGCTTTRHASTRRAWAGSCRRTRSATRTTSTCMPMWATTRRTGPTLPDSSPAKP
nr:RHS repeat domain-containing protein [Variovorax guangxiensis]